MNVVRCPKGHYYDSERFGSNCPFCGTPSDGDATMPLTEPLTPPVTQPVTRNSSNTFTVSETIPEPNNTVPNDKTVPVSADMLDGRIPSPVVGWLVCTKGSNKGYDYRLHQGRNLVGRSPEMDVCIMGDNTVSRRSHAVVVYDPRGNQYLAQPGDAKELFYINEKLVLSATELKAHDRLSVGNTELMFIPLCGEEFKW